MTDAQAVRTVSAVQVRSARLADLPGVAAVLQEAFSDELRTMFSKKPQKVNMLLEAAYTGPVQRGYDGILVAERDGRIIGTLVIEPIYYTPRENRVFEHLAVRELGVPRMLWSSFLLWLIGHRPEPGEAYVSEMAVAREAQGEGVARMLLRYGEVWARNHHRSRMTAWIAANNERAIHVYEQAGYTISRTRTNWLTKTALGIRRWHLMEKPVSATVSPVFD